MKKIIVTFVFLFASINICAHFSRGNNPHDSLLFDGAQDVFIDKQGEKNCGWKVKHVWGTVIGTKDTQYVITHICGIPIDLKKEGIKYHHTTKRSQLKEGDELYDKDSLVMDGTSFIQIEMKGQYTFDPPIILTAKCKNFKVPSCDVNAVPGTQYWFERDPGAKYMFDGFHGEKHTYDMNTDQCIIKPRGTKYSLEQTETDDIIKVYDGSVEVLFKKYESPATMEMVKLTQDYQNGKITPEELTNKAKELQDKIKEESIYVGTKHIVETGFQVTVTGGKIGDPVPIPVDDDRWWDKWEK